jgi:hypothetical protein
MLLHWKDYGTNCSAVLKALDSGIPIYTDRYIKHRLGMDDLPDDLFIFKDDYSIEEGYEMSKDCDSKYIQSTYRRYRNIEDTSEVLQKIIGE